MSCCTHWERKCGRSTARILPRHPIGAEPVRMKLLNAGTPVRATLRRIDEGHANPKRKWQEPGAPEYPGAAVLAKLNAASMMGLERQDFSCCDGAIEIVAVLAPQSVTVNTLSCASYPVA